MYEVTCPSCLEIIEIPLKVLFPGNLCRCTKCWAVLEVVAEHPLRLQRAAGATAAGDRPDETH